MHFTTYETVVKSCSLGKPPKKIKDKKKDAAAQATYETKVTDCKDALHLAIFISLLLCWRDKFNEEDILDVNRSL